MRRLDLSRLLQSFTLLSSHLGVKLLVGPPKGGEDFEHEESRRLVIVNLDTGSPSHGDSTDLDEEDPKKRPKWWHNTISDV